MSQRGRSFAHRTCPVLLGLVASLVTSVAAAQIVEAAYAEPTTRYRHAVLGDDVEYGALRIKTQTGQERVFRLPEVLVFEDTAPRLVDVTGDGLPEVVVVESHAAEGARLAIYDESGRIAATPHIGTSFRWLAPAGAADLDGDGMVEIAYVDRPHLAKRLRVWRFADGTLTEIASAAGHTNHRIGETDIAGGIRVCNGVPEILTASADWSRLLATRLVDDALESRVIGTDTSRAGFARAIACNA